MAAIEKPLSSLAKYLEGKDIDFKRKFRSLIAGNELFNLKFDLSIDEQRRLATERAVFLIKSQILQEHFDDEATGAKDFVNMRLAMGEVASVTDTTIGVKGGVMVWLFGGAILNLGTKDHLDKFHRPLKDLKFTGMFCMSERGHGTNVRGIETEAHYDVTTQEFIINTPNPDASKIYIGNSLGGWFAAVFAQLYLDGKCKGPHCFIVPIRNEDGLMPGVSVTDMGMKEGLNGIDNGILSFDHVRIPRENLLNKYGNVTPEGDYQTAIPNEAARFNVTLAALVGTRLALCFQAIGPMKLGLEIAIRYGLQRRQFGKSNEPEQLIMDYQTHQLRLMPKLATSLALTFAARYAGDLLNDDVNRGLPLHEDRPMQALVAGLKAYCTWEAVDTLQICRECCGGMGYMEENRLSSLKRDADVFVTFEGDNTVMLQQVVKELLQQYASQFGGSKVKATLHAMIQTLKAKLKTSMFARDADPVTSVQYVQKALDFKESELLRTLAARLLNKVSSLKEDPFLAWNDCLDHVGALALCHVQAVTLRKFVEATKACPVAGDRNILRKFCELYAIHLLHHERAWLLEQCYMTPASSKLIRDKYLELCKETRYHALEVVDAFCHPDNCVHAPIAGIPSKTAPWAYYPRETAKL